MKKLICIFTFVFIGVITHGQVVFNKALSNDSLYDFGYDVVETPTGYLIGAHTQNIFNGYHAAYLVRTNFNGDTIWTKEYDLSNGADYIYDIHALNNGGYIICGAMRDSISNSIDGYLMKINELGDSLWLKKFGSNNSEWFNKVDVTPEGGFIAFGIDNNLNAPFYSDAWLVKTDSSGNLLWQKSIDKYGFSDFDGGLLVNPDSTIVISGQTLLSVSTGKGYLFKFKPNGDTIWTKEFGAAVGTYILNMDTTSDKGFVLAGSMTDGINQRAYISKHDSLGNLLWEKDYARGNRNYSFSAVHELANGNFMAAGVDIDEMQPMATGRPRVRMFETNSLGDSLWSKQYSRYWGTSDDYLYEMKVTSDGGCIIVGYIINNPLPQKNDILLIKIDSNGCDTVNCAVGINENEFNEANMLIYPNPTNSTINIKLPILLGKVEASFHLIDVTGKEVLIKNVSSNITQFDVDWLPKGIYFYRYLDKENQLNYSGKLIIQ